jgi:prepilin-type N-terminal cleavage/methylation domain-containing protein
VTGEAGFGLIELLIAMTIMAIGISAIVAGFSSGVVALNRASRTGTAGTLADQQMEAFRAVPYTKIALKASVLPSPQGAAVANAVYTGDSALAGGTQTGNFSLTDTLLASTPTAYQGTYCNTSPVTCQSVRTAVAGPDHWSYRVDTYIVWYCALGTLQTATYHTTAFTQATPGCTDTVLTPPVLQSRPVKLVTVVVRDNATPTKTYVRETSTFDQAT